MRCKFIRTIFENKENGYTVAEFGCGGVTQPDGRNVTDFNAVGFNLPATAAVDFELEGEWKSGKYGYQFEVESAVEIVPQTAAGVEAYLCSGLIKGIGKKLGKAIVKAFGVDSLKVMDHEPEKLKSIPGLGEKRYQAVMGSYTAYRGARDLVTFLAPYGITPNKSVKIYYALGNETLKVIHEDPYKLTKFGIGFPTADKIGLNLGFDPHAALRIAAGTLYALHVFMSLGGHLYADRETLSFQGARLLNTTAETVFPEEIRSAVDSLLKTGDLKRERDFIYLRDVYMSERGAARDLIRLLRAPLRLNVPENLDEEIRKTESRLKIRYSEEQEEAVRACFAHSLNIIVGYPGTGKTTVIRGILDIIQRLNKNPEITLCSPTGRAARRMNEATGLPATTIHKALGIQGDDHENCVDTLIADVVIIDELSMLDMELAGLLFSKIQAGAKVILLGDPDQLPSVGPGAVLSELLRSGKIPCTVLTTIFRQEKQSSIPINAKQIREGVTMLKFASDFIHIDADTCEQASEEIQKLFREEVAAHGLDEVQVLTPLRKKTAVGTEQLNDALQKAVNPPGRAEIKHHGHVFREADKVMHLKNTVMGGIEVNNGDIGIIEHIGKIDGEDTLTVDYGDGRHVPYERDDMEMLTLAYATTVHKSQGSEYATVILTLAGAPDIMLKRNLVYTAITRAKSKLIYVGKLQTLARAIRNVDAARRDTLLADRIVSIVRKLEEREVPEQMKLGQSA